MFANRMYILLLLPVQCMGDMAHLAGEYAVAYLCRHNAPIYA